MKSSNKNTRPQGVKSQRVNRAAGPATQFKPMVAQYKTHISANRNNRPIAPPVYKPQSPQQVAQRQAAAPRKPAVSAPGIRGPEVYRPQPLPKVLQTKRSPGQRRPVVQAPSRLEMITAHAPASAVVRASTIRVVQRAADYSKYDDVWWPKEWRLNGPYKGLDLWDSWGAANRFGRFSSHQISLLIAANKKRNGGVLKSDANNDPHEALAETTGQPDSVECDHVINGKLKGGANHWWNARLISRELNNSLEREVEAKNK